jgi:hypothetical protein
VGRGVRTHRVWSQRMDAEIFQLSLKRFKALDERQFDSNFSTGEEALDDVPRGPERHMAPS